MPSWNRVSSRPAPKKSWSTPPLWRGTTKSGRPAYFAGALAENIPKPGALPRELSSSEPQPATPSQPLAEARRPQRRWRSTLFVVLLAATVAALFLFVHR